MKLPLSDEEIAAQSRNNKAAAYNRKSRAKTKNLGLSSLRYDVKKEHFPIIDSFVRGLGYDVGRR